VLEGREDYNREERWILASCRVGKVGVILRDEEYLYRQLIAVSGSLR
jgi:hypothetical protein